MTRAEHRVTAALLEHAALPTHADQDDDQLLGRLAELLAAAAEDAVEGIAIVGALRDRQVSFDVIRDRGGVPRATACRWNRLYQARRTEPGPAAGGGAPS